MTTEERVKDRQIGVLGMARSGMAVAGLASRCGARVLISDSASEESLSEQIAQLKRFGVAWETGGHSDRLLSSDYLVVSPGVPLNIDIIKSARKKGLPVFSEIEFASWYCPGRIIAVTGSNGKTTTTTLLGEILSAAGMDTFVCGNIGLPFADVVERMTEKSVAVLEVSSFQMETIADFRPHIAVILNLSPDHLDRHADFEAYRRAKYRISENQTTSDYLLLNQDDPELMSATATTKGAIHKFSVDSTDADIIVRNGSLSVCRDNRYTNILPIDQVALPGLHNLQNAAAASLAASLIGASTDVIADVLRRFTGVEHRLETVESVAGIRFINDSKATNVASVAVALQAVDTPIWLILGGRDKGSAYDSIAAAGKDPVRGIVAIGEAKEKIFHELGRLFSVEFADSLAAAVHRCFEMASPGDTVLLSPGCASFDMFKNYEDRGRAFKEVVRSLKDSKKNETVTN